MRLVSWNCNDNLDGKAHELRALEPDIAVIAECAAHLDIASEPNVTHVPGREIKGKSIGVLGFGDWTVEPGQAELEWVLPVTVSGPIDFTLLGVWTVSDYGPGYEAQIAQAIDFYRDELASGTTVMAGDFNGAANLAPPRAAKHLTNVRRLEELGLASAYHASNGVEHGKEADPTYFWHRKLEQPYHCDFCFVPGAWVDHITSVTVGSFEHFVTPNVSDHVPVTVEIDHTALEPDAP